MFSARTHYDVLDLEKDCSIDDVRKSFTKLSKMVNMLESRAKMMRFHYIQRSHLNQSI